MQRRYFVGALVTALVAGTSSALAQNENRPRNRGGGGGSEPAVFRVLAIDSNARTIRLQASDGSETTAKVPEGVYELSRLNVGDRIQVNFYVPDAMNPGPRVAGIWPAN
jgi:hypothetical protein